MGKFLIRDSSELDHQTIVNINDVEVQYTSPMDVKRLRDLEQLSAYHRAAVVESNIAAFLLAMGENCSYPNENYQWFSSLYPNFLYIDRIVVDAKYSVLPSPSHDAMRTSATRATTTPDHCRGARRSLRMNQARRIVAAG